MTAERTQGRSVVMSAGGIVATSQPLASQAGAQVLAAGGTAMDAAIAANAVLGVVEPASCGIGGDLFALYHEAGTRKLSAINASGWAPEGMTLARLRGQGARAAPQSGIESVTVPGAVRGWEALHGRFSSLPWARLMAPAIECAERGFPVTELLAEAWARETEKLERDAEARRVFLPRGRAPEAGEMFRNPEMGAAHRLIADEGSEAMYRGALAKATLATCARLGGCMTAADLAAYQAEWVTPIATEYRGWTVYELPPNSQGVAAIEMLNILSQFPLGTMEARGVEELHLEIEAQKLAYSDLRKFVGDPGFGAIPLGGLTSMEYARERARLIDRGRARGAVAAGNPVRQGSDTVYLASVDEDGNIASLIQSLYSGFGSGVVVEGFGFALQNRGALFELDEAHANVVAGRKRPLQTIIPAFMEKGELSIGFGIMGGMNQAQAHAQFVVNVVDHGMNLQAALEAPRFTKLDAGGCGVAIENRVGVEVLAGLAARGHELEVVGGYSELMGGGQAVMFDSGSGVKFGASDPRKDGAAVPAASAGLGLGWERNDKE